jgi:ribosomal protein S18 acetylase RimI-like enzyme
VSAAAVEIERRDAGAIGELEPLWLTLKNHHGSLTPDRPVHDDATSWERRRIEYAEWLAEEGAFVLVARQDGRPAGYAIVVIHPGSPTWIDPDCYASVVDLAVASDARGAGVGRALIERVHEESGCDVIELAVLSENASALAFYERVGFVPYSVTLRRRRQ